MSGEFWAGIVVGAVGILLLQWLRERDIRKQWEGRLAFMRRALPSAREDWRDPGRSTGSDPRVQ